MSIWSLVFPLVFPISKTPAVDILPLWSSRGYSVSILCINWYIFVFIQRGIWWPLVVLCMCAETIVSAPFILWVCMQEEIKYWCPAVVFYEQKSFGKVNKIEQCVQQREVISSTKIWAVMFVRTAQNSQRNEIGNHLNVPSPSDWTSQMRLLSE